MIAGLAAHGLKAVGAFHPGPGDGAPPGTGTLVLVGAAGGRMWRVFSAAPEAADGAPDPLDRWSRRVIGGIAAGIGARAIFPFDGPPWPPFVRWAARGEGSRPSPVAIPVSPTRGLWASYRGALALAERLELDGARPAPPCPACPAPCLTACPVDAFAGGRYDVAACTAHVASPEGVACRSGCLVRRACPAGAGATPPEAQRRFHMTAFLAARRGG
ncbi:MAG TPA: ferredoxin [Thermohalobaculum sp.]|nr:ferredoxin [Thermohalobaculum sp.]